MCRHGIIVIGNSNCNSNIIGKFLSNSNSNILPYNVIDPMS